MSSAHAYVALHDTGTLKTAKVEAYLETRPEDRPTFGELVQRVNAFGRFDAETYAAVAAAPTASAYLLFALYCSAPPAFFITLQSLSWPPCSQCCFWHSGPQ